MKTSLFLSTPETDFLQIVFGVDEAGRGCLAGPVVAACVAFDWTKPEAIRALDAAVTIRDSKLMTRKARQESAEAIKGAALAWGVGVVDAATIDKINILQATFVAMRQAAEAVGMTGKYLIDGNKRVPGVDWDQEVIVNGDAKVFSIAAASIIAKEHRDALMDAFHIQYPLYAFDRHKGYGTKAHYAAIAAHGVTPLHRTTFLKKILM